MPRISTRTEFEIAKTLKAQVVPTIAEPIRNVMNIFELLPNPKFVGELINL